MEQEIWKDIPGYEGLYRVSNKGRVKSMARQWTAGQGRILNKGESILSELSVGVEHKKYGSGYKAVILSNGLRKQFRINRLVAEAFIPNPDNKPEVNHIDGDKTNNHVNNLEWVTREENQQHAVKTGLRVMPKRSKSPLAKKIIDDSTGVIYNCIEDAADSIQMGRYTLGNMLSGHRKNKTTMRYYNG